jgi:hypothetical protein
MVLDVAGWLEVPSEYPATATQGGGYTAGTTSPFPALALNIPLPSESAGRPKLNSLRLHGR